MYVIQPYLAGDPTNPEIKWTNLSYVEISDILKEEKGVEISKNTGNYSANFRQVIFYPIKSIIKIPMSYYWHYILG